MIIIKRLVLLALLLSPLQVIADTASDLHIQSAFLFAKRKLWNEAIAQARAGGNAILLKYFTWEYLKDPESDASFDAITDFMEQNPDWPDKNALERHAEVTLLADNPSDETLGEWFKAHPPQTSIAKLKTVKDKKALHTLIRNAWVTDDYDKATEAKLLDKYHGILRGEDHAKRIDRLLWEGKDDEAKRLLKFAPYGDQRLFQARLSLAQDKQRAPIDVVNVPPTLKTDSGLLFERIRWRARHDDKDGVRELMLQTSAEIPYPEKWWPLRDRQIREAIGEGNIALAKKLLERHGQKPGTVQYKETQWLTGWIQLEFLGQPNEAYATFSTLFKETETPAGSARVAYWLARAAEKSDKQKNMVGKWLAEAAQYPTTFYGQLAAWEINKQPHISIPQVAEPTSAEKQQFASRELVQLVYALGNAHESDPAGRFIMYLAQNAKTSGEAVLAARLGREIRRIDFSVHAAKKILQNNIVSLASGWPVINTTDTAGVEKPLVLALMRQESDFYADAVSASGACGLMQLLPGTARETAKKSHLSYSANRLFDPDYNMTLGSLYLSKMVAQFEGSYVLSAASYNAGPGRVRQWLSGSGNPGHGVRDVVDWIEKIPNTETRNYVQHVIENTEVYRYVLSGKSSENLMIAEDLTR